MKKYFQLFSGVSVKPAKSWPQWLTLLTGILSQPFFSYFLENHKICWSEAYNSPWFLLLSVIVAVILFPGVYRASFDPNRAEAVQMIPIFTTGIGWESLIGSAVEGVQKKSPEESMTGWIFDAIERIDYIQFLFLA